ncbi:hypothetical protein NIES4102_30420 [Chondrocystis sp. NIES-4102]|nr:hypothetical protein NIES4102_30420 [Chondrocystis sp. NIES-4102]
MFYMDREKSTINQELKFLAETFKYDAVGINFLIELLNHSNLEIRAKAYHLLQNIDSEKVRNSISEGILLNPGDIVYSVYRLGIQFDDQEYYLSPREKDCGFYEDYRELTIEEYEDVQPYNPDIRLSSHISQEEAEAIAELSHRRMIQEWGIAPGGFEWERKDPDFQVKQWCIANNVPYQDEWDKLSDWEIKWKISSYLYELKNYELEDKFQKAQYIYNLDYIEPWCEKNNFPYDKSGDNWDNWKTLTDYLHKPENIALLSKFWKDGIGSLAFVREEIIQKQIYLIPELEELRRKIELSSLEEKLELLPDVVKYGDAGINLLIGKMNGFQLKVSEKAYQILQNLAC